MSKIILKKRFFLTLILLFLAFLLCYHLFFKSQKKEEIYSELLNISIWENEIDKDKLLDLEGDKFWTENSDCIKCQEFDYKDTKDFGRFFMMWCCIRFDKKLNETITEVSMDWEIPERGKNNFIYYRVSDSRPFEGIYLDENGNGSSKIILCGVTREKTAEEIRQLGQEIIIHLNIQYADGKKETKQMTFGNDVTDLNLYEKGNAYNEYFVKTEEEEESISEAVTD